MKPTCTILKNSNFWRLTLLLLLLVNFTTLHAQTLVAGWDFQTTTTGGVAVLASPNTQKVFPANFGNGTIYWNGTNNSSNWFVGASNSELSSFGGTALNAGLGFSTTTTSPACLALLGGAGGTAANGKFAIFSFSMTGFINLTVSYASQRTTTGFSTQVWEYSTNGTTWFPLSTITTIPAAFGVISLPVTSGLNGAATAYLRFSATGATAAAGNNRLDNIQLNATPGVTFNTDPIVGSPFCISNDNSSPVNVSFVYGGTPNAGNIYTAQLSSSTGSFAAPVAIGTLSSVASTGTISATIPAGTISGTGYRIRVISSNPLATATDNGTNLVIDRVVATASNNGPVCAGLSLQLNSTGGVNYTWSGPNGFLSNLQNPSIGITVNADSGVFLATAISTLGCTDTASTLAVVQTCSCIPPTINSSVIMPSCNGGNNGSINITVVGGVAPYTFVWSTGALTEDVSGLAAGTYSVIVTDNILCKDTFDITVGQPTALSTSISVTNPGCLGAGNGSINLTVSGGTPAYTFLWDNMATTEDISGLSAGLYSVTITDNNGCTTNAFGALVDPALFTLSSVNFDVSCAGINNGAINVTASNDNVNNSNPGVLISEFLANPTGTDSSKEWVELIATKFINFATTPYTVIVSNNGTATTQGWVQGGVATATTNGTYAFEISSGIVVAGEVFYVGGSNMAVTGRKLRVKDVSTTGGDGGIGLPTTGGVLGNGGTNADGIAVFNASVATLNPNSIPVDVLFYGTGIGSAVVNAGAAGFTLATNDRYAGGLLQTNSFLGPDAAGNEIHVIASGGYNTLTGLYTQRTWTSSLAISNGSSSVSINGGNTYVWSNGATTEDVSGLAAGTYTVTATSPTGCVATLSAVVNAPTTLVLSGTIFNVSCFGLSDGSIDLTVSGGTAPYTFLWSDANINEDRTLLLAGTYSVTVTDASGCTAQASYTVTQPNDILYTTLVTNTSCFGASDGAIDLTVTGGTAPYTFSWSSGDLTEDIINQPASFYFFNITDANNCNTGGIEFINDPAQIIINNFVPNTGGAGVQVTINGSGFTGASAVHFDGIPASSFNVVSDFQITAIVPPGADTGFISVFTSATCVVASADTFFYNPLACIPPSISAIATGASCFGASDGSINLTVSGGMSPYSFSWSNGANSEDLAGITAGNYSVIVSDAASCPDTLAVIVTEPGIINGTGVITNVSCNGSSNGSINLTVSGGTAPYTFSWSNGASTEDISSISAGTYTVTMIDNNSCAGQTTFILIDPPVLSAALNGINPLCAGTSTGSVVAVVNGGVAPYSYLWNTSATTASLSNVPAGNYTLTVTDNFGCSIVVSTTLTDPTPFTLSVNSSTNVTCFGGADGAIDLSASNDPVAPPVNPGLLISEFFADPAGVDHPFEWIELVATKSIDFSVTPYTIVAANNGTATIQGWRAGGVLTYAFQISSGVVNPGDVFYVGGSSMSPTGTKLRTINTLTTAGDGFGSANGGGIGNGGANADGIAVFNVPSSSITAATVPVDAIFFGTGLGTAIVNVGLNGYTLPTNDRYAGGLLAAGAFLGPNSVSGSYIAATGSFNRTTGLYTTPRSWVLSPTFTNNTTSVTVSTNNTYIWSNGATTQDIADLAAGTYSVTATSPLGCVATASIVINQPQPVSVTFVSTPSSGANGTVTATATGGNGVYTYSWADESLITVGNGNPLTGLSAGLYYCLVTDGNSCVNDYTEDSIRVDSVITSGATFNITAYIEGFYTGTGPLDSVLIRSGLLAGSNECDTIRVELRDQLTPTTVLASGTGVLSTSGQVSFNFPSSLIGMNGYIVLLHRNAVQTWSSLITFSAITNHNFTTAATQAYDPINSQREIVPGVWAIYSGDVNQDEFIEIIDQGVIDNDIANFSSGYVLSDLNGDGFVDILDQSIADNNIFNFIGSVHP